MSIITQSRGRKIIHIDCDCFFAAVEMRDNPALAQRPIAVGGAANRRGVIATCNYQARAFGVHSAMPSAVALRRCPDLLILPPRFDAYKAVSAQIHAHFLQFTDLIEPLSLDEAYLDVSESPDFNNRASKMASILRQRIAEDVGITVSAGVSHNKLLAKIASDWRKPNGLFVITPEQSSAFIAPLPVAKLPGVGPVTAKRLSAMGADTCEALQQWSRADLVNELGRFGNRLYDLCRAIDHRPVSTQRERKSISVERTFNDDRVELSDWYAALDELWPRLTQRIEKHQEISTITTLVAKIKYHDFVSVSSHVGLGHFQQPLQADSFKPLLAELWQRRAEPARLVGIGVRCRDETLSLQGDLFQLDEPNL